MKKPNNGEYLVRFYDAHRKAIKKLDIHTEHFVDAKAIGYKELSGKANSFTIDRRMYDSMDTEER